MRDLGTQERRVQQARQLDVVDEQRYRVVMRPVWGGIEALVKRSPATARWRPQAQRASRTLASFLVPG